ncbi:Hypothetical protein NTJ_01330 [Nesidiocoris tenuis]|uniref:Odorant receptor n=1 Tax=Nesidiocoris tenuis TaxID=355587 RepID=A0ABN7A8A4_9HEMI|nr:Hypothetical protein NTJ_01330 [Nesidiocoris tenuis]
MCYGSMLFWRKSYTFSFFFIMTTGMVMAGGFVYGAYLESHKEVMLETLNMILLAVNMFVQLTSNQIHAHKLVNFFRAIDKGIYDYETLDKETALEIQQGRDEMRETKKRFAYNWKILMVCCLTAITLKRPATVLILGKGFRETDGANNLIWGAPVCVYMPFANYWVPYVIGWIMSTGYCCSIAIAGLGASLMYVYITVELIYEFEALKTILCKSTRRAEDLYSRRNGTTSMEDCLVECIKESVKHHHILLREYQNFKDVESVPLFMIIFDGGIVLGLSAYLIIGDGISLQVKVAMVMLTSVEFSLAVLYAYYSQRIKDACFSIGDGLYEADWIEHSRKIKVHMNMIKAFCNTSNELTAAGFAPVNMETILKILYAGYTYMGLVFTMW